MRHLHRPLTSLGGCVQAAAQIFAKSDCRERSWFWIMTVDMVQRSENIANSVEHCREFVPLAVELNSLPSAITSESPRLASRGEVRDLGNRERLAGDTELQEEGVFDLGGVKSRKAQKITKLALNSAGIVLCRNTSVNRRAFRSDLGGQPAEESRVHS